MLVKSQEEYMHHMIVVIVEKESTVSQNYLLIVITPFQEDKRLFLEHMEEYFVLDVLEIGI
jgi:hypothetical protein